MGTFNGIGFKLLSASLLPGIGKSTRQWTASLSRTDPSRRSYAKSAEELLGLDKPKRPVSVFIKYANQIRKSIADKDPSLSQTDIIKQVSERWQRLDQTSKDKLTKAYEADVENYKKMKAKFEASLTPAMKEDISRMEFELFAAKKKRKMKAEVKELGKPKRPMSSYLLFCQSQRDSVEDTDVIRFQLRMKEKWYNLSQTEKEKYEKKAQELKNNYRKEMTVWEEKMMKMGNVDFVRNKSLGEKKRTDAKKSVA